MVCDIRTNTRHLDMTTFLDIVAEDLYKKTVGNLANITIVFPNKRASLFFNKALAELTDQPIWSPKYITISELFRNHSTLETGDRIKLICELYLSYREVTCSNEPLDKFYGWGEVMLNDFDDIDKHMADARKVFSLLSDIHELDSVEYLTERQQEALQRFFSNFSTQHNSELKKRFLRLWNKYGDIYTNYRQRLLSQGIAYEGMLYRDVIENRIGAQSDNTENQTYIFIGFNLLHKVETEMFKHFQSRGKAKFYWDYDTYYIIGHEAGTYISQYLRLFPNELPDDHSAYNNFRNQKEVTFISSPTEDLQARYISEWLTPERISAGRRTAIVLADEGLLETVIHCLPPEVKHVNITTGYPLEKSAIASLLRLTMMLLQRKSYTLHTVNAILRHPLAKYISDQTTTLHDSLNSQTIYYPTLSDLAVDKNLEQFFTPLQDPDSCLGINERLLWLVKTIALHIPQSDDLTREALYRTHAILNRLQGIASDEWTYNLYQGVLQQIIQTTTIPFHGEPIEGIQIMGVLETRNLDFEHLLLLSCNEGKLPAKINDTSFIPHSVRLGYGLTTIDNKVAIYAYYFHRLLQRVHYADILYNNSTDKGHTGEMSRFMLQLIAESGLDIGRKTLVTGQESITYHPQEKAKTPEMVQTLIERGYFSPSALGKYLRCPLIFFYKYISGIHDNDENDEEEMDTRAFGNIFHKAAEMMYQPSLPTAQQEGTAQGRTVTAGHIDSLLNEKGLMTLRRIVDMAFRTELFKINDDKRRTPRLSGLQMINREMIVTFLKNTLEYDRKYTPFHVIATEYKVYDSVDVCVNGNTHCISIGGSIDRLDSFTDSDGTQRIRVIDYKTGRIPNGKNLKMGSIEDIFTPEKISGHSDYFLQALMYASIVSEQYNHPIVPALLFVQHTTNEDYSPLLTIGKEPVTDIRTYKEEYTKNIQNLITEILNVQIPFKPTADRKRCDRCIYKKFCH